ncbi:dual specificity protein kinase Yak1p [[Candida] railenensis]|uniref:Dual specificity protein kinase Yak1p n=1 Tax=[Candida] railenensis TaxID=45579 RepID=A0A9P0QR07_9ASCO|nr:dual specificity protein kinase Yak1p [[Candida] railenensis]
MSYNYNSNRHNSIGGNWHLRPNKDQSSSSSSSSSTLGPNSSSPNTSSSTSTSTGPIDLRSEQIPGFRNPWFNSNNLPNSSNSNMSNLSHSPTKGNQLGIPLLQQQSPSQSAAAQRRLSFATQLPTTYENGDHRSSIVPPYIHPPTRADNPFNQYYTSQEVSLGGGNSANVQAGPSADRRMSAAGTYAGGQFNAYQTNQGISGLYQQSQQQQQQQQQQLPNGSVFPPHLNQYSIGGNAGAAVAARRSSVAAANYQQLPYDPSSARSSFYSSQSSQLHHLQQQQLQQQQQQQLFHPSQFPFAQGHPGRSLSIVQYNQYQTDIQQQRLTNRRKPAPKITKVNNKFDLKPKQNQQPKYRRCSVNSIHISPVNALSIYLTETYGICQPRKFQYSKSTNPKRVLTKPSEPKFNNGFDNEDSDYILYVNDILGTEEGRKYIVLDLLGCGTFGQVVKCQNLSNQSLCAVKVIKSKPAYMNQSLTEVRLLEFLNTNSNGKNFIRLIDTFMHKEHLCLVFELLASNLYELIKQNQFQGLNMRLVKLLTKQLLESLAQLKGFQMIHCDLKPENILLCQPDKPDIKVIDFGSACFTRQTTYTYIQSRFYRSPEVILGLPYTESIDMWSLGCIVGELFLGLPMFPGNSEYNQIWKIVDMLGNPPRHMIEVGRSALNFFHKTPANSSEEKPSYRIKNIDEYTEWLNNSSRTGGGRDSEGVKEEKPNKQYFKNQLLKDIILNYKFPSRMTATMIEREWEERFLLLDFLSKVLNMNPLERLTPQEALKHPFVNENADKASTNAAINAANAIAGHTQHPHPHLRSQTQQTQPSMQQQIPGQRRETSSGLSQSQSARNHASQLV